MPLTDIFAAVRWWAALMLLGAAATPLAFHLFRPLPGRGYAFVKMLGLLIVSFLFWLLSSLGFLGNDVGAVLLALGALVAASAWAYRRSDGEVAAWLRENRRYVITAELVFALIFFLWAWVRAQNPAITATEKPMEFAFLNASGRSATMPPLDPWLSGFAISYYYFGYVMTSVIARLAAVAEPVAFNLGIAWLAAGTSVGAFGLVFNLIAAGREKARRAALVLGVVAALALPLAGNMEMLLEVAHANGVGSTAFWEWLNVRDLNTAPDPAGEARYTQAFPWWWWRSSRVINEHSLSGEVVQGLEPIAEFPGFSFILGDMHPHVLALPFAFLSLAVALAWWLKLTVNSEQSTVNSQQMSMDGRGIMEQGRFLLQEIGWPLWGVTVLVLGGLSFLNTWDVAIHLFVVLGAFVLSRWRRAGRWDNRFLAQGVLVAVLLVLPAILLYLPFYLGFRSQAGPPFLLPTLVRPTRLAHFLVIFGMPLWSILIFVAMLVARKRKRNWKLAVFTAVGIVAVLLLLMLALGVVIAASTEGSQRVIDLAAELGLILSPLPPESPLFARFSWGLSAVAALVPDVLQARLRLPWLTLLLASLTGLSVMLMAPGREDGNGQQSPTTTGTGTALPFVLLLVLAGALLTLAPEFLYLRDNFGVRLNTIFKFYYQAWVLFGVAALFGLDYLWRRVRPAGVVAAAGYGALLAVALLFPVYAASSRAQEYGNPSTLDGIDHYRHNTPDEYAALTWLRQNVAGTPVIVEAVGGQYSPQGHGRVSASTGLPTILGWAGHEYQWRGSTPEPAERDPAVQTIYADANWENTAAMLDKYNVELIYVGPLEVNTYGPQAAEKFAGRLEVAYSNGSVTIYRWLPDQSSVISGR